MTRQAQYLFVAELAAGKVVLEVGAGDGAGARFLAEHGATRVIGIDSDRDAIMAARARHSLSNLELRHEHPARIELEDDSVGCVFVPDGAGLLRRRGVLAEIRRVLVAGGPLVVTTAAAERPGAIGGATFHEIIERLSPQFGAVRMIAQGSLHAVALVGFGDEDDDDISSVVLDRSLADGALAVTHYVAVCGGEALDLHPLALVELPGAVAREVTVVGADDAIPRAVPADERTERVVDVARIASAGPPAVPEGPELVARALAEHAQHARELEAVIAEARAETTASNEALARERARSEELERALEAERSRADRLGAQLDDMRDRAARAEGDVLRLEAGRLHMDERAGDLQGRLLRVEDRRAELERNLEEAEEARARLEAKVALAEAAAEDMGRVLGDLGNPAETARAPVSPGEGASPGEVSPLGIAALRRVEAELAAVRSLLQPLETGLQALEDGLVHADDSADGDADRRMRQMAMEIGVKEAEMTLLNIGLSTLQRRLKDVVETARTTRRAMQDCSAGEMLELMDGLQRALSALA